jgi:hypothetical protein
MSSPYWQEDQMRLQRIKSLERRPNLSLSEQVQLGSEKNTLQNLRNAALREAQFRISEKDAALRGAQFRISEKEFPLKERQIELDLAKTKIGMAAIGDIGQAGQRAYTLGREQEELERLKMAAEGSRYQSQMRFMPQMEALRGGIMGRMAGQLGMNLPKFDGQPYSSGTGYTPSWAQSYQVPKFPRY